MESTVERHEELEILDDVFYKRAIEQFFITERFARDPIFVFDEIDRRMLFRISERDSLVALSGDRSSHVHESFLVYDLEESLSVDDELLSDRMLELWLGMIESARDERVIPRLEMEIVAREDRFFPTRGDDETEVGLVGRFILGETRILGEAKHRLSRLDIGDMIVKCTDAIYELFGDREDGCFSLFVGGLVSVHPFSAIVRSELGEKVEDLMHVARVK